MESRWLISYTPGPWVVLAGPTALVAVDAGVEPHDDVVADLWAQVGAGVGMRDLVGHLARIEYARLPKLAVVFFESAGGEGLRALLRGAVRVLSATGQTLAHGEDVLTWQEVRLAALDRVEIDLGVLEGQALPLVHGGVRAGRLRLVKTSDVRHVPSASVSAPDASVGSAAARQAGDPAGTTEVPGSLPPDGAEPPAPTASTAAPAPDDDTLPSEPEPRSPELEEMEDADTELMYPAPGDAPDDPPAIARLRAPDGSTVDLDRAVLIGRAPSNAGFENAQPHLLTVLSPSQDISRTHVLVAPEGDAIVVTDLHSTNGTMVVRPGPGVEREALGSGESISVEVGTVLELGDEVAIMVDAAP